MSLFPVVGGFDYPARSGSAVVEYIVVVDRELLRYMGYLLAVSDGHSTIRWMVPPIGVFPQLQNTFCMPPS